MARKWRPSATFKGGPFWSSVNNAYPNRQGQYVSSFVWATYGAAGAGPAVPGTTLKAWCTSIPAGTGVGYVGTTTKLYSTAEFTAFIDRSKGGGYTATRWNFAQYGNFTIATNNVNPPQVRDATGVAAFADLAGTPPTTAKIPVVQSNVLLFFNTNSGGHYWAASDAGNHANFTTGDATSGFIAHRPGAITAAVAFKDVVIVFKDSSIYRMRYVGSPYFWTVELIADGIGASGQDAVLSCGDALIFIGSFGQWLYDGATFRRADEGFFDYSGLVIPQSLLESAFYLPNEDAVWFGTRSAGVSAYIYNKTSDRWGQLSFYKSGASAIQNTYVPITGAAGDLAAIFGTSITRIVLVDLSTNPTTLSTTSKWGDQTGGASSGVTLNGFGNGQDSRTTYIGLVPTFAPYVYSPGNEGALTDFLLTLTDYDTITSTASAHTATGNASARAIDFNFNARFLQADLITTSKPFVIDDVRLIEAGASPN